jgi:hypothetical protein
MKKLLCLSLVLASALTLAFGEGKAVAFRAFLPLDFGGTYTYSAGNVDVNYDTKFGVGVGAELEATVWQGLAVGIGLQGNFGRGIDDEAVSEDARFGFVPIYGLVSYGFDLEALRPYAVARIGYNVHTGNDEYKMDQELAGGVCFGLGAGASFKVPSWPVQPFVELDYAYSSGGFKDVEDVSISYKRFQLCVGAAYSL